MIAKCISSLLCLAVTVNAGIVATSGGHSVQHRKQDDYGNYQFGYDIVNGYGAVNGRHEAGGAYGPVHGSYYLGDIDGRHRQVHYVADKLGFRAVVKTNEPGTKTSAPAAAPYVSANGKAVPAASVQAAPVAIVKPPLLWSRRLPFLWLLTRQLPTTVMLDSVGLVMATVLAMVATEVTGGYGGYGHGYLG
ncbi:hypothetical protein MRX96_023446 [Rhipicephalus microplus]